MSGAMLVIPPTFLHGVDKEHFYIVTSSSSLARQPLVGPGLLKKLYSFVSVEDDFLPIPDPLHSHILISTILHIVTFNTITFVRPG
jgi:hypothetical protein